jgi:hypothetical protein
MEELKVTVSFECEDETRNWLKDEARKEHGISVSSLIRRIIDFYRQNHHNGNGQSPVNGEAAV